MNGFRKIGEIAPKRGADFADSRLGIGFEKLDRGVFDPEKAYDKLAAIGVKWVRLQSGWMRTEKEKGVYDFAWLDIVVDNLIARGLRPWMCLCYGNPLYDTHAAEVYGAVGCPPIHTREQREAWANYVTATVKHYKGRVSHYEIWNEPDGEWCWKHGPNGTELGNFTAATARVIRAANPEAYIIGAALAKDVPFLNEALQTDMANEIDAVSYHAYVWHDVDVAVRARAVRAACDLYNPALEVIQGESGTQSRNDGHGALKKGNWTPVRQSKYLLRHLVVDLSMGVKFASYFSCMDMIEALNGLNADKASYLDYGYFGVLGATFDENGFSTGEYAPKPSYYALQNLAALLGGNLQNIELPITMQRELPPYYNMISRNLESYESYTASFRLDNGALAYTYWATTDVLTMEYDSFVSLNVGLPAPAEIHLFDPTDGAIYEIPADRITDNGHGNYFLSKLPARDYPLFLIFGDLPDMK